MRSDKHTDAELDLGPRLRRSKLDLLPILHELLRTGSLTRTGRALGMSQPAVSKALRQLRAEFGDDLLVSLGRGVRLTDRAETLIAPLHRALSEIDELLRPAAAFEPAREQLRITITTADYVSALLAPALTEICAREAPCVVFQFIDAGFRSVEDLSRVDFLIAPRAYRQALGKRIGHVALWRDEVVCIAGRDSPVGPRLAPADFQRLRQAAYTLSPRVPPQVRAMLMPTAGLETRIACSVPDFLVLGAIVERTDCVALVPRKLAEHLCRARALRIVELAYPRRQFANDACWSLAATGKRGHAWARDLLVRAAQQLA